MNFFEQFGIAIKAYIKAISFVFNNGLWIYFIYPLLISLLLFFGGYALVHQFSDFVQNWLMQIVNPYIANSSWLSYLTNILSFVINILFAIIFYFFYSAIVKYIVLIIMSPVMALLSERADEIITGKKYKFNFSQFLHDILRGISIAIRNMLIELSIILFCFILVWIPIIGWLSPVFLLIVSYYFYGFSMIDYTSERRKLNVTESVAYIRKNKGLAIGNGFVFALVFAFPIIGAIVVAVLAPIAATIAVLEIEK